MRAFRYERSAADRDCRQRPPLARMVAPHSFLGLRLERASAQIAIVVRSRARPREWEQWGEMIAVASQRQPQRPGPYPGRRRETYVLVPHGFLHKVLSPHARRPGWWGLGGGRA